MIVRSATADDAAAVAAIYNPFVRETVVTFEESDVEPDEMARRIEEIRRTHLWLVAVDGGRVVGYAYASPWKGRSAYRRSAELTVYVAPTHRRRGVASRLYAALIDDLRERSIHAVLGGVALPNAASVALHEALGFEKVAHLREVGWKLGRWVDVGYWELIL